MAQTFDIEIYFNSLRYSMKTNLSQQGNSKTNRMLMRFYCIDQNSRIKELPFHLLKKSLPSYKVYPLKYGCLHWTYTPMQVSLKQNVIEIQFATCDSVNVLSLIVVCAFYQKTRLYYIQDLTFLVFYFANKTFQRFFFWEKRRSFTSNYTHHGALP